LEIEINFDVADCRAHFSRISRPIHTIYIAFESP
jgi:hypothetical protein